MTFVLGIDTSQDLRKSVRREVFGDIKKSVYRFNDDWAGKFYGNPDHRVEALKMVKEARGLQRQRDANWQKYGDYDKINRMGPVARAKHDEKRKADEKRLRDKEQDLCKRGDVLEDKMLDQRIAEATRNAKEAKLAAKGVGALAVHAGKMAAGQAQRFVGREGQAAVAGAHEGAERGRQAFASKPQVKEKTPTAKPTAAKPVAAQPVASAKPKPAPAAAPAPAPAAAPVAQAKAPTPAPWRGGGGAPAQKPDPSVAPRVKPAGGDATNARGSAPAAAHAPDAGQSPMVQRRNKVQYGAHSTMAQPKPKANRAEDATRKSEGMEPMATKSKKKKKHDVVKAHNVDVDIDDGAFGIADFGGEIAMNVHPNPKCAGCQHFNQNRTVCSIGLLPTVCGDGSFPEAGYSPVAPSRATGKEQRQLHSDAVAMPAQAENHTIVQDIPYRIEVLGDSALELSERMTLMKAAVQDKQRLAAWIWHHHTKPETRSKYKKMEPKAKQGKKHQGHGRPTKQFMSDLEAKLGKSDGWYAPEVIQSVMEMTGEEILWGRYNNVSHLHKSANIDDFAQAMGTTVDVVRDIARRLGDKSEFADFVKGKLPDIAMAHGLDETAINQLYRQAVRMVKGLSDSQWSAWKGHSFANTVSDDAVASAIERNGGLLDRNAIVHGAITGRSHPAETATDTVEKSTAAEEVVRKPAFIGGNLALASVNFNRLT